MCKRTRTVAVFGLFGPEVVRFIDMQGDTVTFQSQKKRQAGTACQVRFTLQMQPKPKNLDLPLGLVSVRPYTNGPGLLCVGQIGVADADLKSIEDMLRAYALKADLGPQARRSARQPVSLRVLSKDLPGYGGITADLSCHGVRVSTHAAVPIGKDLQIGIQLDIHGSPVVQGRGRVVWCAPSVHSRGCFVGIDLYDMDETNRELLKRYMKSLADRNSGDVMHKSISDTEVFVRPSDNVQKN